jgi:hypothetical protein
MKIANTDNFKLMDRSLIANIVSSIFSISVIAIGIWIDRFRKKQEEKKRLSTRQHHIQQYRPITFDDRLPTLSKNNFELIDIAESAGSINYINPLPTLAEKNDLVVGDLVKLKFMDKEKDIERMWVEIVNRQGDLFEGIITNGSIIFPRLDNNGEIWFHANHIFEIHG